MFSKCSTMAVLAQARPTHVLGKMLKTFPEVVFEAPNESRTGWGGGFRGYATALR